MDTIHTDDKWQLLYLSTSSYARFLYAVPNAPPVPPGQSATCFQDAMEKQELCELNSNVLGEEHVCNTGDEIRYLQLCRLGFVGSIMNAEYTFYDAPDSPFDADMNFIGESLCAWKLEGTKETVLKMFEVATNILKLSDETHAELNPYAQLDWDPTVMWLSWIPESQMDQDFFSKSRDAARDQMK
jgi:hypothetical protein